MLIIFFACIKLWYKLLFLFFSSPQFCIEKPLFYCGEFANIFLFIYLFFPFHSSGFLKKTNDGGRLIITTFIGVLIGYFVGRSFQSVSFSKVYWPPLVYTYAAVGNYHPFWFVIGSCRFIFQQALVHRLT